MALPSTSLHPKSIELDPALSVRESPTPQAGELDTYIVTCVIVHIETENYIDIVWDSKRFPKSV